MPLLFIPSNKSLYNKVIPEGEFSLRMIKLFSPEAYSFDAFVGRTPFLKMDTPEISSLVLHFYISNMMRNYDIFYQA
jgi:hypothetical protein